MDTYTELAQQAIAAKEFANPPYSNFHVGAALLTRKGEVYTGANIESSSYGLTMCAERTAIFKAVSEGQREFTAIAIASDSQDYISPCGACRQVIIDQCGNIDVVMVDGNGNTRVMKAAALLPLAFTKDVLDALNEGE